jgi:cytochrome c-type biogenesis protein CcmH/NrfG
MTREALIFGISGTCFGLLVGWILGSQQPQRGATPAAPAAQTAQATSPGSPTPPPLDVRRAAELERTANSQPSDPAVRAQLGDLYFDAERFDQAIPWYEASLKLQPKNVNASTDLAVCYYYANDPQRALQQIDHSLSVDPRHAKTLLNQGIIRAFGTQDLPGAFDSWRKVVDVSPGSEEAKRAQQLIDGLKSGHPAVGAADTAGGRGGG